MLPNDPNQPTNKISRPTQTKRHWLSKHPVEFSKNNHTPSEPHTRPLKSNQPHPAPTRQALLLPYLTVFGVSNRLPRSVTLRTVRYPLSTREVSLASDHRIWQTGRLRSPADSPGSCRPLPYPVGLAAPNRPSGRLGGHRPTSYIGGIPRWSWCRVEWAKEFRPRLPVPRWQRESYADSVSHVKSSGSGPRHTVAQRGGRAVTPTSDVVDGPRVSWVTPPARTTRCRATGLAGSAPTEAHGRCPLVRLGPGGRSSRPGSPPQPGPGLLRALPGRRRARCTGAGRPPCTARATSPDAAPGAVLEGQPHQQDPHSCRNQAKLSRSGIYPTSGTTTQRRAKEIMKWWTSP